MHNITSENAMQLQYERKEWIETMKFVCEVALMTFIGVFGILGNLSTITMFLRMGSNQLKFHRLMVLLAIFDITYIILNIWMFVVPGLSKPYHNLGYEYLFAPITMPLTQICLTGSVYCTMAISMERYLTVCHPFYTASTKWSAKRYIIPILFISVIYNFTRFFELSTVYSEAHSQNEGETFDFENVASLRNVSFIKLRKQFLASAKNLSLGNLQYGQLEKTPFSYSIDGTALRKNKYYYSSTLILNLIFMAVGPFMVIFVLASLTLRRLTDISKRENIISSHNRLQSIHIETYPELSKTMITDEGIQQLQNQSESDAQILPSHRPGSCSNIHRLSIGTTSLLKRTSGVTPFIVTKRLKTNEIALSKVSLIISLVFILCHSIRFVPNIYELVVRIQARNEHVHWPEWVDCFTYLSHLLTVFNSSVNFYIYYFIRNEIKSGNCFHICCSTRNIP